MADQPFIFFPRPESVPPHRGFGRGRKYGKPTPEQQRQRLDERFRQIAQSFTGLDVTVAGLEPEQVVVLETISAIHNVTKAAARIPGLEWLSESDLSDVDAEFGFRDEQDLTKKLPRRLYALFSSQTAMDQLIKLWREWVADPDKRAKSGFGPFKNLFIHLRDIRRWGPQDRIAMTGLLEDWQEDLAVMGNQGTMLFEVELWFRANQEKRQQAQNEVQTFISEMGGQLIDAATIPEILYHAVLAEISAAVAQQTIEQIAQREYSRLLQSRHVMFLRPRAQAKFSGAPLESAAFDLTERLIGSLPPTGNPLVAIIDGMPLPNHAALSGRIVVDDPDSHAEFYAVGQNHHGTAMASLIVHGDLHLNESALATPVYVRPILQPSEFNSDEEVTPPRKLLIDLIHRSVRRLFESEGGTPPAAPDVHVINLSIGDPTRPFDREISSLARLVDWLAWKYNVLFIISAGNHGSEIVIEATDSTWRGLANEDLARQVMVAMRNEQYRRRTLSPSEAINAIAVGAIHADGAGNVVASPRIDLLAGRRLPSPVGTVATGFRRSTKPEIMLPGGRQVYEAPTTNNGVPATFRASRSARAPGILTAAPGLAPMELNRVSYSCGTSNAAALASRCAGLACERIRQLDLPQDCDPLNRAEMTALLKTLLVHAAGWGDSARVISEVFSDVIEDWRDRIRLLQQFLGYGEVQLSRCLSSTDERATLLGWSSIRAGEGHVFRLPLPPSLSATTELRRLTATLAWIGPTNQHHRNYRQANLFLNLNESELGTRTIAIDTHTARRGTVEHRIFEGEEAKAFLVGATLEIQINCKEDAGKFDYPVPYGIAVSVEVGAGVNIGVYQEISTRIRPQVQVTAETNS